MLFSCVRVGFAAFVLLLRPERAERVHPGSAAGRTERGDQAGREQHQRHGRVDCRIVGPRIEQERTDSRDGMSLADTLSNDTSPRPQRSSSEPATDVSG